MNEPKLRFKNIDENEFPKWEEKKLGEVAIVKVGEKPKLILDNATYEYINAGTTNSGYVDSYNCDGDTVTTPSRGQGGIGHVGYQKHEFWLGPLCYKIKSYEDDILTKFIYYALSFDSKKIIDLKKVGTIPAINRADLIELYINFPCLPEQQKIVSLFTELDTLIQSAEKELDGYRELKQGMLQKMFPKKGEKVPEVRFPEFTGDWEQRKLKDMCTIITKQTGFDYSATIKPSLVTTKEDDTYSFIQNKDFEGLNINLETDFYIPISVAEKYPKITLDQPSLLISISGRIGNIGLYQLDSKAFIGGAVGICKLKDIEDGKTTLYELSSPAGQMYFNSLIKASSHANITVEDIRNIEVLLPKHVEERKKINVYFENLDNLITLQQQELDGYKELKKGLLQQMFC